MTKDNQLANELFVVVYLRTMAMCRQRRTVSQALLPGSYSLKSRRAVKYSTAFAARVLSKTIIYSPGPWYLVPGRKSSILDFEHIHDFLQFL